MTNEPAWLVQARAELGVHETPGPVSTKKIMDYRIEAGIRIAGDDSDVPWCAIFVNAMLHKAGVKGSGNAAARGFQLWGDRLAGPALGAITVLSSSRGPTSGHVAFYLGETATHLQLLGGNQGDAVSIALFPKAKLVGFYWPKGLILPATGPVRIAASAPAHDVRDA